MNTPDTILQLAALGWGVLCGGMLYEHVAVIPQWTRRPPESLAMWTGEYRLRAERFWMGIHPVLLTLLGAALLLGWSSDARRSLLLTVLGGYAAVIAATAAWYVPELLRLTQDPAAPIAAPEWRRRARRWEVLSAVRGALILALAWPLLRAVSLIGP